MRPLDILLGKSIPGLLIGLAEGSVVVVAAVLWFHVPLNGSLAALYLGLTLFVLSVTGVGLMISSLVATQQQALLGVFIFMVPSIILSGFATPISNMPVPIQYLTYLNPLRYALVIVRRCFLDDPSLGSLMSLYGPMAVLAVISLALADWLFRRRAI